jgi:hypothetical protein
VCIAQVDVDYLRTLAVSAHVVTEDWQCLERLLYRVLLCIGRSARYNLRNSLISCVAEPPVSVTN